MTHRTRRQNPHITCLGLTCPERFGNRCLWDRSGLLSSEQWHELTKRTEAVVLDPDGWDRIYFELSWFRERITYMEYCNRRNLSTCQFNPDFVKQEIELAVLTKTVPGLPTVEIHKELNNIPEQACSVCGIQFKLEHDCLIGISG